MAKNIQCLVQGRPIDVVVQGDDVALSGAEQGPVILGDSRDGFSVRWNGKTYHAQVVQSDFRERSFTLRINHYRLDVQVKDETDAVLAGLGVAASAGKKINDLRSPMPGMVLDILTQPGAEVRKGDPLLILEAMKMENILRAPKDAVIGQILIEKGKAVEKNQMLIQFA